MSEVSSVDSTSIIVVLLRIVAHVHDQMETGIEDNTIQWGNRLLIQDLSEDDTLMHFCFCKAHLHRIADRLTPRLLVSLSGNRSSVKENNGTYSLLYVYFSSPCTLHAVRPRCIRNEMEGFFVLHKSRISTGSTCMTNAMYEEECSTLTILLYFMTGCHILLRKFIKNVGWLKLYGNLLMEHSAGHVDQTCFKKSCTVVTSGALEPGFNQQLHQMACLYPCMVW